MAGLNHQTEKQNISHQFLRCPSSPTQFTSLTAPHPQFQTPKCKHSFLNYPSRTKEEEEKTEQRGGRGTPIMLVQALEYMSKRTGTKGIAPRLWFCRDFFHLQPPGNKIHLQLWSDNICLCLQQQCSSFFSRPES